jgi:hypothetical protein
LTGIVSLPIGTPHTPLRFHLTPSPPPTPSLCRFSFSVSSSWLAFVLLLHLTLHTARHSIHFNDDLPHPRSLPLPKGLRAEPQVRSTWRPSLCLWGTACPASIVDPNWHSRHPPSIPFLLPFPPVAVSLTLRNETISVAPSLLPPPIPPLTRFNLYVCRPGSCIGIFLPFCRVQYPYQPPPLVPPTHLPFRQGSLCVPHGLLMSQV